MKGQFVVVPLLEGVCSSADALGLESTTVIDDVECQVLLPDPRPLDSTYASGNLMPPDYRIGKDGRQWPVNADWGYFKRNVPETVIVNSVGLVPGDWSDDSRSQFDVPGFDYEVGLWRRLLSDWLSVVAEGLTSFHGPPVKGETWWESERYNQDIRTEHAFLVPYPRRVSRWQWEHVFSHIRSGEEPPLSRLLLAAAEQAAATGNSRLAVIDAATAAEIALTVGLASRLSSEASPQVAQALTDRTRMLGPRLDLARDLGMAVPERIRPDLLESRNTAVHRGTRVTSEAAQAAIAAAAQLVNTYEPLDAHCREPSTGL